MDAVLWGAVAMSFISYSNAILCYNCSSSEVEFSEQCMGPFQQPTPEVLHSFPIVNMVVNCSDELYDKAYCFSRKSYQRSEPTWILQRGCYFPEDNEFSVLSKVQVYSPFCEHKRGSDYEVSLCVCSGDFCNSAINIFASSVLYGLSVVLFI